MEDLGELVVVDDREREGELPAAFRAGGEEVGFGTDCRRHRGDDLLTDGIERRVGDLGEQLAEVVEEQPRAFGQHGDRRVGAHRPERLATLGSHRGDDDLELLVGVAEQLLATQHAVVAEHDVLALGKIGELDEPPVEPLLVRVFGGEGGLDLPIVDDAPLGGVDEEHPARLEASLDDHLGRVDVDDADLRGHHHEVIVGHPVAARAQAVSVEDGADHRAVRERHARRTVPRLHHRGVEAVERPLRRVHLAVVLPRFGDHHQHRVMQRAATQVEQLEGLVEARRVGRPGRADRERPLEAGYVRAGEHRLAGAHPVLVALDRVDLAVVGDEAVRVGERPRREGVRREPAVHQSEGALETLVGEIGEELGELGGRQHPLVHEGPR